MHKPIITAASALSISSAALAQSNDAPDVTVTFTPSATYTFESELKNEPGDFSLATAGADLSFTFSLADNLTLIAGLSHETAFYNFSDATTLTPGTNDPFDTAFSQSLSLSALINHNNDTSLLLRAAVNNAFADGADASDAFTYSIAAGVQFKISQTVSLSLGGGFRTRLENNTIAIPLLQLDWQINDSTRFTAQGTSLKLAHDIDDENTIHIRGGFEAREYRLDDSTPTARDGSFEHLRIPLAAGWTHSPDDNLSIMLEAGAILWQEIEVRTGSGRRIAEYEADPALFFVLTATIRF